MFVTLAYIACIVSRIVYMLNGDELYMLKSNKAMLCYVKWVSNLKFDMHDRENIKKTTGAEVNSFTAIGNNKRLLQTA